MPLLSKSQTIVRYQVEKIKDENILKTIENRLIENTIPEIEDKYTEINAGWTSFENPYNPDFKKDVFQYGNFFLFSLRIDKKSIPAKVLQQQMVIEINKKLKEQDREFISKNEKTEIKEFIIDKLLFQIPFTPNTIDVVWDYDNNIIMFYSNQKAANELFETLFFKSFNRKMHMIFPYTLAVKNASLEDINSITQLKAAQIGGLTC